MSDDLSPLLQQPSVSCDHARALVFDLEGQHIWIHFGIGVTYGHCHRCRWPQPEDGKVIMANTR